MPSPFAWPSHLLTSGPGSSGFQRFKSDGLSTFLSLFLNLINTGTEKGAWIHIRGWKKRPQISVDRQVLQLSQGKGMTIRHIKRSRNLPDPEFLQKRQDEGLRTPVERDVSPSPLHVPPVTQHKENACPHTIWSLSQHLLFIMSLSQWQHSPGPCLCLHCPSPTCTWMQSLLSDFTYFIKKYGTTSSSKYKVTECVLAEAGCTTLSFKNSPQISLASWICSQNITLLFVILFLQLFLKCFSVLPKLPRLCCYLNTADGTGVKQALWKLTVFLEKSTKWTSTSKWLKSFSSDGENNSETYCDTTWAVSPQ